MIAIIPTTSLGFLQSFRMKLSLYILGNHNSIELHCWGGGGAGVGRGVYLD